MMTFFIIATIIILIGVLSYFTSARFGVKSSNTDKLPPYYAHLLRQLKEKEKQGEGTEDVVNNDEVSNNR
ncbi:hypothetical protein [Spirosoma flavum]|uniref:DUF3951 domain-containing protein n=1 Tax=Spirosoma flavum TaxID=2048557 RepID=A0ABW6AMK1_9BACT